MHCLSQLLAQSADKRARCAGLLTSAKRMRVEPKLAPDSDRGLELNGFGLVTLHSDFAPAKIITISKLDKSGCPIFERLDNIDEL